MENKFNESVSKVVDDFLRSRLLLNQKLIYSHATKEYMWKMYEDWVSSKKCYYEKMLESGFDLDVYNLVKEDFSNHHYCEISGDMFCYFAIDNEMSNDIFSDILLNEDEINNLLYYVKKAILAGGIGDKPFVLNEGSFIKKLLDYLIDKKDLPKEEEEQVKNWLKYFNVSDCSFFKKETMSKLVLKSNGLFGIYTGGGSFLSIVNNEGHINLKYQIKHDCWHYIDDLYYGYIVTNKKRIIWIFKKIEDEIYITDYFSLINNRPYLNQEEVFEIHVVDSLENFFRENNLLVFRQSLYHDKDFEKIRSILNFALGDLEPTKEKVLYFHNKKLKNYYYD